MTSRADEPYLGETRAERRRRLQAEQLRGASASAAGPYDPRPYGVRAYPDIEDAVLEEYVAGPLLEEDVAEAALPAPPQPPNPAARQGESGQTEWGQAQSGHTESGPRRPAFAEDTPSGGAGEGSPTPATRAAEPAPGTDEEPTSRTPHRAGGAPTASDGDAGPAAPAATEPPADDPTEPARHVAHRAYGRHARPGTGPAARPGAVIPAVPDAAADGRHEGPAAEPARPGHSESVGEVASPRPGVPSAAAVPPAVPPAAPGPPTGPSAAPLAGLTDSEDASEVAARLQLLAAKAAAERLARPRKAIGQSAESAPRPDERADRSDHLDRGERARRAADKIAADKVAAARRAAVRAAAEQRATGAARAARLSTAATRASLPAAATAASPTSASASAAAASPVPAGSPASAASPAAKTAQPGATPPAGASAATRARGNSGRRPRLLTPRRTKIAYTGAAIAVLAGGIALAAPTVAALLTQASPGAPPTSTGTTPPAAASTSAGATGASSPAATPSGASSAMACDPGQWAEQVTGEAPETFTASGVAQAYCLTAGTVRDIGFTDLAAKKATPYVASDFDMVKPYLSPALRTQWDKDVADFVKSQDLASPSGRRISALTTLAWGDRDGLKFDPAASSRATDFAVGKPVTWVVKGTDGVNRLGVGFETGLVTHMVDGAGRKQDRILKRTYKMLLVKGDAAHPWLIDAYEIGQSMAGLSTTTVPPTGSGTSRSGAPASPTTKAS